MNAGQLRNTRIAIQKWLNIAGLNTLEAAAKERQLPISDRKQIKKAP